MLAMRYRHRISTDIDIFFPIGLSETLASQHGDELWENALKGIIDGEYDDLPESAFYMVGTIEEAVEKAKTMAAEVSSGSSAAA